MGRVEGKVALITGAARGQGRSHATRLAEEGADIIAVDICDQIENVPFPMATRADLEQTVKEVEALGRRIVASVADVRDYDGLAAAVDNGVAQLGRLDVVCANAGVGTFGATESVSARDWATVIDVDLNGVWHTTKAALPHLRASGGGSIIVTSSGAGQKGTGNMPHYVAAKTGLLGYARSLAKEVAKDWIRVNSILPTTVDTDMIHNDAMYKLFRPDLESPTREDTLSAYEGLNLLQVPWVESIDISNAVLFLASDESRYITGIEMPVDAGYLIK